jgi:hypothetical protein
VEWHWQPQHRTLFPHGDLADQWSGSGRRGSWQQRRLGQRRVVRDRNANSDADSNAYCDSDVYSDPNSDRDCHSNGYSNVFPNADGYGYIHAYPNRDSYGDSDTNSHANTDWKSRTDRRSIRFRQWQWPEQWRFSLSVHPRRRAKHLCFGPL